MAPPGKYGQGVIDLLLAFATLMGLAALVLLAGAAVTLLPAMLTAERAEDRGLDPTVWGAISWVTSIVFLVVAFGLHKHGVLWLIPLPFTFAALLAVQQVGHAGARVPGAHR